MRQRSVRPPLAWGRALAEGPLHEGEERFAEVHDGLVTDGLLEGALLDQVVLPVEAVEGGEENAQRQQALGQRDHHPQQHVGRPQSGKAEEAAQQPCQDGHHDEDHHEEGDEAPRGGELLVEAEPAAHHRTVARGEPDAGQDAGQRAYLHDEALLPAVPEGQKQQQAYHQVYCIHRSIVSILRQR